MKRHIQKGRTKLQFSMKVTNLLSQCHKSDNDNNTQKKKKQTIHQIAQNKWQQ